LELGGQTLVQLTKVGATTTPVYLHPDLLGSPRKASSGTGALLWQEHYDPYGAKLNGSETTVGYTGHAHDATGLTYMKARFYDPSQHRFLPPDPIHFVDDNPFTFNRYAYANNNPYRCKDPTGKYVEAGFEAISLAVGVDSFIDNVSSGNFVGAAVDAVGVAVDAVGAAIPGVPGVAGLGIKASRETGEAAARIADDALVVRGGAATPNGGNSVEGIAAGTGVHPSGVEGFSAEAQNGASLCDLCANVVQNQVGVTTAGQIRAAGGDVVSTSGRSPNHATVTGLSREAANKLLTPTQPNPVPKDERNFR